MSKKKKLNIALLEPKHSLYADMRRLLRTHHAELNHLQPKIALAWRFGWTADADGKMRAGQCRKASDLDRELHHYDFVILLNFEFYNEKLQDESDEAAMHRRQAVLDHEICHCGWQVDKQGDPKRDEKNRVCWRIRKHDIEEFHEIGLRYGEYEPSVAEFFRVATLRRSAPLLEAAGEDDIRINELNAGIDSVSMTIDGKTVKIDGPDALKRFLQAGDLAAKIAGMRQSARDLFGDRYEAVVSAKREELLECMRGHDVSAVAAVHKLASEEKLTHADFVGLLAACAGLVEQPERASA